ncbi:MAG TPA: LLM class flavin-dependent oxidoreductase, partial [Dehalococcoidia bacterium]|nr:LLM class flavin-dependent oxidoreductase [Dehalococcoidia bacterium]
FGLFMAPYHPVNDSMTLTIRRDIRTIQWLDELGYDEVFIGEHHSGGWEPISSPEVFIAHVAQETESIKLGTGVVSMGYHSPYMLAERILLLDHLTRGRVMLGVGPGATAPDNAQFGFDATELRPRLDEGLGVVLRLLRGEEVTHTSPGWFTLKNASCQLQPYHEEGIPVFLATTSSPGGAVIAGKHGVGILSGGSFQPLGPGLKSTWDTAVDSAAQNGKTLSRRDYRVMTRIYVAESREQACKDMTRGLYQFDRDYISGTLGRPFTYEGPPEDYAKWCVENGSALFGSPEEVTASLERLWESSNGGIGGILLMGNEFASPERMRNHYELLARYVMPHFQGSFERPMRSHSRAVTERVVNNQNEANATAAAIRAAGGEVPPTILGTSVEQ